MQVALRTMETLTQGKRAAVGNSRCGTVQAAVNSAAVNRAAVRKAAVHQHVIILKSYAECI